MTDTLSPFGRAETDRVVSTLSTMTGRRVSVSGPGGVRVDSIVAAGWRPDGVPFVTRRLPGGQLDILQGSDLLISYGGFALRLYRRSSAEVSAAARPIVDRMADAISKGWTR